MATLSVAATAVPSTGPSVELQLVATVPYVDGTHIETPTIKGRDYVFAATQSTSRAAELRVVDVTSPARPRVVAKLDCGMFQGHLQISADKKTLILGVDRPADDGGKCIPARGEGFATIDITDPTRPKPIGFAQFAGGSHSTATHPTQPLVYNAPDGGSPAPDKGAAPALDVWSIANPRAPRLVASIPMPGVFSPHDLSFSPDGTMAATANITTFHLMDTSDPYRPKVMYTGQCPGCQHAHEARFTADSKTLVVNDEAIAGRPYPCPGGAMYFYSIDGPRTAPSVALKGTYVIDDLGPNSEGTNGFCTPHVFDISADGTKIATSWHSGGVRYLDITTSTGQTIGARWMSAATAVKQLAAYTTRDGDYFTAKLHRGPWIYAVDQNAGLQVFRITSVPS